MQGQNQATFICEQLKQQIKQLYSTAPPNILIGRRVALPKSNKPKTINAHFTRLLS